MKKILPLLLSTSILIGPIGTIAFADTQTDYLDKTETESVFSLDAVDTIKKDNELSNNIGTNTNDKNEKSMLGHFLQANKKIERISGVNRSDTSVEISKFAFSSSQKVIIADASDYPDALSASSITDGKYPVLLIQGKLTNNVKNEISRLAATEVVIVGGYNSIPRSVERDLKHISSDITINRISGINRYETNANSFIYSNKENVVLASGENFPDALASAPLLKSSSLLLTKKNSLSPYIFKIFRDYKIKSIEVSGGKNVVSENLLNYISSSYRIDNIERLSGENRYETSTKIAQIFNSKLAIIASGDNFPDALAASSLSQKTNAPILLVSKNRISRDIARYIKDRNIEKLIILGGENSISKETEDNLLRLLNGEILENVIKPKLQYQFVHFFVLPEKISVLDLKYMSRIGLVY